MTILDYLGELSVITTVIRMWEESMEEEAI